MADDGLCTRCRRDEKFTAQTNDEVMIMEFSRPNARDNNKVNVEARNTPIQIETSEIRLIYFIKKKKIVNNDKFLEFSRVKTSLF